MSKTMMLVTAVMVGSVAVGQVSVEEREGEYLVRGAEYEAVVAGDGMLTSLKIDGLEFVECREGNPRGVYVWQDGPQKLADIARDGDAIEAKSETAKVRWEFNERSMKWSLENLGDTDTLLLIVFDQALGAIIDESGIALKAPTQWNSSEVTFFREQANLRLTAGGRCWGPWEEAHQCWNVTLKAKESCEVTVDINAASEDQIAQAAAVAAREVKPPEEPDGPMWDLDALSETPETYPADGFEEDGVRALFYDGVPFQGRPTRVFAWVGLPDVPPGEKVPGMVLVHGGGGTAFANWVRLWTERGYAAISMDTCGCVPRGAYGAWERHEHGGPPGWGGWGQVDWPREDQWTYHAIAAAVLGHSLLRSMPEVDADRIGLTGISWGGYLASILAGVDTRLKFVAPVYGCGYQLDSGFAGSVEGLGGEKTDRWMRWWDPSVYLKDAELPMLWVTGTNDFAYWLPALQKSYRTTPGPETLCVTLEMPHGHGPAGEGPEEIRAFADSILKGSAPLAQFTEQGRDGTDVWATFEAEAIERAELLHTTDATDEWPERKWVIAEAQLEEGRASATLPEGVTVYYLNIIDEEGLTVSTEHAEVTE